MDSPTYKAMENKINKHIQNQTHKPNTDMKFYHRVVNKTNITFSDDELGLLNRGVKYNLSKKTETMDQQLGAGSRDGSDTTATRRTRLCTPPSCKKT